MNHIARITDNSTPDEVRMEVMLREARPRTALLLCGLFIMCSTALLVGLWISRGQSGTFILFSGAVLLTVAFLATWRTFRSRQRLIISDLSMEITTKDRYLRSESVTLDISGLAAVRVTYQPWKAARLSLVGSDKATHILLGLGSRWMSPSSAETLANSLADVLEISIEETRIEGIVDGLRNALYER